MLTLANALLGHGQLSLAKYLLIAAAEDNPELDVRDVPDFFRHVLERVDWRRDLHFQTGTTIDTLDYSSGRLHEGSKAGDRGRRSSAADAADQLRRSRLAGNLGFRRPRVVLPGVLVVEGPAYRGNVAQPPSAVFNGRVARP